MAILRNAVNVDTNNFENHRMSKVSPKHLSCLANVGFKTDFKCH